VKAISLTLKLNIRDLTAGGRYTIGISRRRFLMSGEVGDEKGEKYFLDEHFLFLRFE